MTGPWIAWNEKREHAIYFGDEDRDETPHAFWGKRGYEIIPVSLASKAPEMREMLVMWRQDEGYCGICGASSRDEDECSPDCALAKLLADTEEGA